jgi:branched-chain amino acid transport system permease protein
MELFLHQVLAGLATGGIYACMALAVVMIYQAIDHLNFAQGEMAMFSTFIAWQLIQWGIPYWLAFALTIAISFAAGFVIERVVLKPIHDAPILSHVVAFIALLAILNSSAGFLWDWTIKNFASPFGSGQFLGQNLLSKHDAGMIGVTILMLVALYLFFRHTRIGLAMRAAAESLKDWSGDLARNVNYSATDHRGMTSIFLVQIKGGKLVQIAGYRGAA